MTSILAALVRDCALKSIRSTVAAIDAFLADYTARVRARQTRLLASRGAVTRLAGRTALTLASKSTDLFAAHLAMAHNQIEVAIAGIASLITTVAKTQRVTVLALPDALGALVDTFGSASVSLPSSGAVCAKVDETLRLQLALASNALDTTRLEADTRLQAVDQQLQQLEAALARARLPLA